MPDKKFGSFSASTTKEALSSYFTCAFVWAAFGGFLVERAFYARNFGFQAMIAGTSPLMLAFPYALYISSGYVHKSTKSAGTTALASALSFVVGVCLVLWYPYATQAIWELVGPSPDDVFLPESEAAAVGHAEAEYGGDWQVIRNSGISAPTVFFFGKTGLYRVTVSDGSAEKTYAIYRDNGQMVVKEQ